MHKFGIIYFFVFSFSFIFNYDFYSYLFNYLSNMPIHSFFTYKKPSSDNSYEQPLEGLYYPRIPDFKIRRTANAKTATLMRARIDFAFKRLAMRAPA